jgi:hypothetical protein
MAIFSDLKSLGTDRYTTGRYTITIPQIAGLSDHSFVLYLDFIIMKIMEQINIRSRLKRTYSRTEKTHS